MFYAYLHAPLPNPPTTVSPDDLPEPECTPEGVPIPAFTPWRAKRERAGGWLPETQRAFIHELTRIGSVGAAARAVGKSGRSAYQLRDKSGAESFAAAWEEAKLSGQDHARQVAIQRGLHGEMVPTFRDGRFTGYRMVGNDQLLVAAIAATPSASDTEGAARLRLYRLRLEKWEEALRREAMDLADGTAQTQAERDAAWQDHLVWQRETKREARRQRDAEIRAAVRKGMAKIAAPAAVPRIRVL